MSIGERFLKWGFRHLSLYPPFLGAGIRVTTSDPGGGIYQVKMRLTPLNRNAHNTHFGGSLYAMCDPFLALILIHQLGSDYAVWDKSATIDFLRPGKGVVTATMQIAADEVAAIRKRAASGEAVEPVFVVDVVDRAEHVVARVTKTLHVRKRNRTSGETPGNE